MKIASRRDILGIGILLLVAAGAVVVVWFYILGPYRRISDMGWERAHTEQQVWAETQKSIRRMGWAHDDGFRVGLWGNKEWVARIMDNMSPGDSLSCSGGHKEIALSCMTNQQAGAADDWLTWWQKNKHKTQEEWIRDGFAARGILLHEPLTKKDILALLRVLGERDVSGDEQH
ncbi:MAG: hypothetical protein ABIF82_01375, partial [Planctomycetota bacterium]